MYLDIQAHIPCTFQTHHYSLVHTFLISKVSAFFNILILCEPLFITLISQKAIILSRSIETLDLCADLRDTTVITVNKG